MSTWKLVLEYDGSRYSGWQEQKNARTVAGEVRRAAEALFRAEADLQGAGRTDAGVHALAQVAHLRVKGRVHRRDEDILRALNSELPADIAVLSVEDAPARFHARHDAISRRYLYQVATRKMAFRKKYVWWVKERLDAAAMSRAAKLLAGRHDFAAFRASDPARPEESTIVVVNSASVAEDGDLILIRIDASHFLWRMVRRIVGALVKLGAGEIAEGDLQKLLSGRPDPRLDIAAWTAPGAGLFLEAVQYPTPPRADAGTPRPPAP